MNQKKILSRTTDGGDIEVLLSASRTSCCDCCDSCCCCCRWPPAAAPFALRALLLPVAAVALTARLPPLLPLPLSGGGGTGGGAGCRGAVLPAEQPETELRIADKLSAPKCDRPTPWLAVLADCDEQATAALGDEHAEDGEARV